MGAAAKMPAQAIAGIANTGGVKLMKGLERPVRVPPGCGHGREMGNFRRVNGG